MVGEQMKIFGTYNTSKRVSLGAALVLVLALAGAVKADTVTTYDVTGTFASGGTLSGTFTVDYNPASFGVNPITAVNLTADGVTFTNCPGAMSNYCNVYTNLEGGTADGFQLASPSGYPLLELTWGAVNLSDAPVLTLMSNTQCIDCGTNGNTPYGPYGGYFDNLTSATAVASPNGNTAVPEGGSTLVMLLAGLLSLGLFAGWQSRRGTLAGQLI
jgi:hypothetical protein